MAIQETVSHSWQLEEAFSYHTYKHPDLVTHIWDVPNEMYIFQSHTFPHVIILSYTV